MRVPVVLAPRLGVLALPVLLLGAFLLPEAAPAQPAVRKLTATEAASHVLARLAFGARPGQVKQLTQAGWQRWVEEQLSPDSIPEGSLPELLAERCPSLALSLNELQDFVGQDRRQARSSSPAAGSTATSRRPGPAAIRPSAPSPCNPCCPGRCAAGIPCWPGQTRTRHWP